MESPLLDSKENDLKSGAVFDDFVRDINIKQHKKQGMIHSTNDSDNFASNLAHLNLDVVSYRAVVFAATASTSSFPVLPFLVLGF